MMKRIAPLLLLLLCAPAVFAQCTPASGAAITCSPGVTTANIASAVSGVTDGGTITFTPGTYSFTNAYVQLIAVSKGFTIQCQTAPLVNGAATTNPCTYITNSHLLGFTTTPSPVSTHVIRFTGFQLQISGSPSVFFFGDCNGAANSSGGYSQFRFDHNTVDATSSAASVPNIIAPQTAGTTCRLVLNGIADHNLFQSTLWGANNGNYTVYQAQGARATTDPAPPLSTVNNFFLEDNVINFPKILNAGAGVVDGWSDTAALVVRYNTITDGLLPMHGTKHGGGPPNWEVYNNSITCDANATGFTDCQNVLHHQGATTWMVFNNNITTSSAISGSAIILQHYRSFEGSADGYQAFPCNNQDTRDGNRTPVASNYGYPCWRQPGRDVNGKYTPIYSWNNINTNTGNNVLMVLNNFGGTIPNGSFPPNNCTTGASGNCDYFSFQMLSDRERYNAVSASAQSSPTSPFNGTTGMGFGTLANQPTTCTTSSETAFGNGAAGVGYAVMTTIGTIGATTTGTGEGTPTNAVLYTCSATNTWTIYYTPFTYPHPLVATPPVATFTPSPVNVGLVPQNLTSNPVSVTLQNTGVTTLTNTAITLNSSLFTIQSNTCGSPATITNSIPGTGFTLAANATCTFQVIVSPTALGPATANLVFAENTAGGSDTLVLNATVTGAPAPAPTIFAGEFKTSSLCPQLTGKTAFCFADDCSCWLASISGGPYKTLGVSSVNGKVGNVVLSVQ